MDENLFSFCSLKPIIEKNKMSIEKQIVFTQNLDILFYINDKLLSIDLVDSQLFFSKMTKYDIEDVILNFDKKNFLEEAHFLPIFQVCKYTFLNSTYLCKLMINLQFLTEFYSIKIFLGIVIKYGIIHSNDIWYHKNCMVLININKSRCERCERLCSIFRAKLHYLESCKKKKSIKRLGPMLTPNRKNTLLGIKKKTIYLRKSNLRCLLHAI